MAKMVFNPETMKMEKANQTKAEKGGIVKISLVGNLASQLKAIAKEDGYSFKGISYVTKKDKEGNTLKDKDGNPMYELDKDNKPKTIAVEESHAKVTNAIGQYVEIAVKLYIAGRNSVNG